MLGFVWVNVYSVTQVYGGPEEGGWWYPHYQLQEAFYLPKVISRWYQKRLRKSYEAEGLLPDSFAVYIELKEGASETTERMGYE